MALMTSLFKVLLISSLSVQVQAHVCYIGQESAAEKGYRWCIAERNPCECTEFRLGGLNSKPQPHSNGVGGVHYVPFKTNKEKFREVLGCENASTEMDESPCDGFTTRRGVIEKVSKLELPVEMELTIGQELGGILYFDTKTPTTEYSKFSVEVGPGFNSAIYLNQNGGWQLQDSTSSWNFIGSLVIITFDGMSIKVGLKGIPESYIIYSSNNPSLGGDEWFIGLYGNSEDTVWSFYKPCGLFKDGESHWA